jgi:hypothetical protein
MIPRLATAAAVLAVGALPPVTAAAHPASATAATAPKAGKQAQRAAAPCRGGRRGAPTTRRRERGRAKCAIVRRARRPAAGGPLERLLGVAPGPLPAPAPGPDPPEAPAPGAPALPRFVSVAAREFSLTLSRPLVGAGGVTVELRNSGEDPHNLVVSPEGTHSPLASFSELDPGTYERHSVTLAAGRYRLWCSLEFHEGLGMSTTLRVE